MLLDARGAVIGRNGAATALFGPGDPPSLWTLTGVTGFSDWLEGAGDRRPGTMCSEAGCTPGGPAAFL